MPLAAAVNGGLPLQRRPEWNLLNHLPILHRDEAPGGPGRPWVTPGGAGWTRLQQHQVVQNIRITS